MLHILGYLFILVFSMFLLLGLRNLIYSLLFFSKKVSFWLDLKAVLLMMVVAYWYQSSTRHSNYKDWKKKKNHIAPFWENKAMDICQDFPHFSEEGNIPSINQYTKHGERILGEKSRVEEKGRRGPYMYCTAFLFRKWTRTLKNGFTFWATGSKCQEIPRHQFFL